MLVKEAVSSDGSKIAGHVGGYLVIWEVKENVGLENVKNLSI
jgi:hypothetical protein